MEVILQELSPANLVTAIEQNISHWIPTMCVLGRMTTNEPQGLKRSLVDIPYGLFNSIVDTHLSPDRVEAAIEVIKADARSRHVPIYWWMTPSTQPPDIGEQLLRHGFTLIGDDPGMAVDLTRLNEGLEQVPGLTIRQVEDDASTWLWCRTMAAGFEIPPQAEFVVKAWHDLFSRKNEGRITIYLGWLDGQPVATTLSFLAGGVAGIYSVATIPSARRKGIGTWMTLHPLLQARALGYKAGILEASEMGVGVYRKVGFREYCRIRSYAFQP